MLHIVLLILKVIGIILAVLLGLILLILMIVLFLPVNYRLDAKGESTVESIDAAAAVTWLFGIIKGTVSFKEKKLSYRVRAAWFTLFEEPEKKQEKKRNEKSRKQKRDENPEKADEPFEFEKIEERDEDEPGRKSETPEQTPEPDRDIDSGSEEDRGTYEEKPGLPPPSEEPEQSAPKSSGKKRKSSKKGPGLKEKFQKLRDKASDVFAKVHDTAADVNDKKNKVLDFADNETHIAALIKLKDVGFHLISRYLPKKVSGDVTFGFEDPSLTGKVFGGICMFYPLLSDTLRVTPDFTEKVLSGDLHVKGHIRVVHLVTAALKLLLSKAVRRTYKDVRNFKF